MTSYATVREGDNIQCLTRKGDKLKRVAGKISIVSDDFLVVSGQDGSVEKIDFTNIWGPVRTSSYYPPEIRAVLSSCLTKLLKKHAFKTQRELNLFVEGYLRGMAAQQNYRCYQLKAEDVERIKSDCGSILLKPFYFTFDGSGRQPYKDGYCIVLAENLQSAVEKFQRRFPPVGRRARFRNAYNEQNWKQIEKNFRNCAAHETLA